MIPSHRLNRRNVLFGAILPALLPAKALAQAATAGTPFDRPVLSPAQAAAAVRVLQEAQTHGLPPIDIAAQADPAAVTAAVLRYAHDVHVGRLEPDAFPSDWGVRPQPYDPSADFAAAVATDRLESWLESLPPPYSGYKALKRGLARYREIAQTGGWRQIPEGPPLRLGVNDPRVAVLRARLAAEDKETPRNGSAFDAALQQAVIRAQRRFGLQPDGVVSGATLQALNQPVGQRVLQIIANMERWRWLPPQMPSTRVQVNSGAAIVTLFRDDKPVLSMKAVSGRPGDETPMLFSNIHSVVLNPPWNVPSSIATRELWPKERKSPGYLSRNGFRVISTGDGGRRLQQVAGDQSALGRFKFDFENPYGVYLHDTPTQSTFSRYGRQASHGCVRLEKPQALAEALLQGDAKWTPDAISSQILTDETVRVRLTQQVPVFIFYWTAFAGADGQMNFRTDPYNWDRALLQRVGVLGATSQA